MNKKNQKIKKITMSVILILYILLLFKLIILKHMSVSLFIDEMINSSIWHMLPRPFEQYNLVPFDTIKLFMNSYGLINPKIIINNILGNVLLFVPLGYLLKIVFNKKINIILLFIIGVSFSLTFEVMQYISGFGILDIDDLILNSIGIIIGLIVGAITIFFMKKSEKMEEKLWKKNGL